MVLGRLGQPAKVLKSPATGSSIVSTPISPHTTRLRTPTCAGCHQNPARLGLGRGPWPLGARVGADTSRFPGLNWHADWDRLVDQGHRPIQGTTHKGARPLNHEEITRVLRFGFCLPCHSDPRDPVVRNPERAYQLVGKGGKLRARHKRMVEQWFQGRK